MVIWFQGFLHRPCTDSFPSPYFCRMSERIFTNFTFSGLHETPNFRFNVLSEMSNTESTSQSCDLSLASSSSHIRGALALYYATVEFLQCSVITLWFRSCFFFFLEQLEEISWSGHSWGLKLNEALLWRRTFILPNFFYATDFYIFNHFKVTGSSLSLLLVSCYNIKVLLYMFVGFRGSSL